MSLFRTNYADAEEVLRTAPGPAPWYLEAFPPILTGVVWQDSNEIEPNTGATLLTRISGDVVALVGMYCYVLALDKDRFVVWYQGYDSRLNKHFNTIDFHFLNVADLKPLKDIKASLKSLREENKYFVADAINEKLFSLPTDLEPGKRELDFGDEFNCTDEMLLWGYSTSESFLPRWGKNNNLCLFVLRPQSGTLEVIPQDWFNNSDDLDYGYQWVTRVARDSKTSNVYGDGIRLSRFILDKSLKEVEKWFDDDPYFKQSK